MKKQGFEFIKIKGKSNFRKNASDYSLFPPIYKFFTELFELGEDGFTFDRYYLHEKDMYYHTQIMYYHPRGKDEGNITFTHFDTPDDVVNNWQKKLGYTQEEIGDNFLRIGGIALGGGLFIGTKKESRDNVYLHVWDSAEGLIKLEDNIFDFVKELVLEEEEFLPGKINHAQLYKNWGEDFWRVRDKDDL